MKDTRGDGTAYYNSLGSKQIYTRSANEAGTYFLLTCNLDDYIQAISEQTNILQRSDAIRFLSVKHLQQGTSVH